MKATVVAHPIQGLIKYHGLKDARLRLPYHNSISACIGALSTTTTVETISSSKVDSLIINGQSVCRLELDRVRFMPTRLRKMARSKRGFKIASTNSVVGGKGLGFSASAFAALGKAA